MTSSCKAVDGWLTDYSYRRIFYWQSNLDNAQDVLTVDYILNQTQPDFEDLRVTLNDGETLLPIWNQTTVNMDYCTFWCLFPTANATYYLYWGNPIATAVWNQTAVFVDVIGGVVGAWPLNEESASNPVVDYSGYGNNGTATFTSIVNGRFEGSNARYFNGSTDFIYVTGDSAFYPDNFTVSFWMQLNSHSVDWQGIVGTRVVGAYNWFIWSADHVGTPNSIAFGVFYADGLQFYTSSALTLNTWNLITLSKDGVTVKCYINDTLGTTMTGSGAYSEDEVVNLGLGGRADGSDKSNVSLSNLFITTEILSIELSELQTNYADLTLDEGNAIVRVWADSSITLWGETETYITTPEYSSGEILGVTIALIITFFSVALVLTLVRRKRNE